MPMISRLIPVILVQRHWEQRDEQKTMYTEMTGANVSSIDFSRDVAIIGFGLRPTGTAIPSDEDKVSFKSEVEDRCVRYEWLNPVWEEPF